MTRYIALVRAVNLGGRNPLGMSDLRDLAARLGHGEARTLLASGNLLFENRARPTAALERELEAAARKRLGLETEFFVRTADEWRAIVEANPFPKEARKDPARLVLMCLKGTPGTKEFAALQAAIQGREVVRGGERAAYFVYPDGQGRSKLTPAVIEKKLGTRGTARNWNTVLKLAALAGA